MNALPVWDAEQRAGAPVPTIYPVPALPAEDTAIDSAAAPATEAAHAPLTIDVTTYPDLAGDPRRLALARALADLEPTTGPVDAVAHLLAAVDAADAEAGIARVDTSDAVLTQRITRIVSGAALPSRGPATRAREILGLLHDGTTA